MTYEYYDLASEAIQAILFMIFMMGWGLFLSILYGGLPIFFAVYLLIKINKFLKIRYLEKAIKNPEHNIFFVIIFFLILIVTRIPFWSKLMFSIIPPDGGPFKFVSLFIYKYF